MTYTILKELTVNGSIEKGTFVTIISDTDIFYQYDNLEDAENKLLELRNNEIEGREYTIFVED
jgi:tRNA nucleotidyltransferase (CCA-adding enzyme)